MTWKDSFSIGIPQIDKQHKQLCDSIDNLYAACSQGKGSVEVLNLIDFLESYTIKHFSDEEKLQVEIKYPKYNQHKALHDDFVKQISNLKKEITTSGANMPQVINLNHIVSTWLIKHIMSEDMALTQYIK